LRTPAARTAATAASNGLQSPDHWSTRK